MDTKYCMNLSNVKKKLKSERNQPIDPPSRFHNCSKLTLAGDNNGRKKLVPTSK